MHIGVQSSCIQCTQCYPELSENAGWLLNIGLNQTRVLLLGDSKDVEKQEGEKRQKEKDGGRLRN